MSKIYPENSREWVFLVVGGLLGFILFSGQSTTETSDSSDVTLDSTTVIDNDLSGASSQGNDSSTSESNQTEAPVIVFQNGDGQTAPFFLNGGNYEVLYQTYENCVYYVDLESISENYVEQVFSSDTTEETRGYLYDVPSGDFYLSAITGPTCSWRVTFNPLLN